MPNPVFNEVFKLGNKVNSLLKIWANILNCKYLSKMKFTLFFVFAFVFKNR
jgi:hypothetical protein